MRRRLCGKLHGVQSQLLFARPAVVDPVNRYWLRIAILPTPPAFDATVRGSPSEYFNKFGTEN